MNFKKGQKVWFSHYVNDLENDNSECGIIKDIKYWSTDNMPIYIIETEQGNILETNNIYSTEEEMKSEEYGIDEEGKWFGDMLKQSAGQPTQPKPTEPAGMGLIWAWEPTSNMWIRVKEDEAISTVKQQNQTSYNQTNTQTENTSTINYTTAKLEENYIKEMEQKLASLIKEDSIFGKDKADKDLIKAGFIEYAGYNLSKGAQYRVSKLGLDFSNQYNLNLAKKDFIDIKSSKEEEIEIKQIKDIEPIEKEVERNYASQKCSLAINFEDKIEASLAKKDLALNGYKSIQQDNKLFIETNKKTTANLKTSLTKLLLNLGFEKVNYDI